MVALERLHVPNLPIRMRDSTLFVRMSRLQRLRRALSHLNGVDVEVVKAKQSNGILRIGVSHSIKQSGRREPHCRGGGRMEDTCTSKPITNARTKSAAFCSDETSSVCSDVCTQRFNRA